MDACFGAERALVRDFGYLACAKSLGFLGITQIIFSLAKVLRIIQRFRSTHHQNNISPLIELRATNKVFKLFEAWII